MPNHTGPMACPVDGVTLVMSERQGVEIDYCPQCRGVWLDRGELDKIIERGAGGNPLTGTGTVTVASFDMTRTSATFAPPTGLIQARSPSGRPVFAAHALQPVRLIR